jgi:hypothetical protein
MEAVSSSASTAKEAFTAPGTGSTRLGRRLTPSSDQLRCTGCRPLLEWTLTGFFAKGRLSRAGLHLYSLGSLGSKNVRFRFQPEFQIPSLRATCVLPKLGGQARNGVSVRVSCGYMISIHGNKYEPALKQQTPLLITFIHGFQQQWHRTCRPGRHLRTRPRVLGVVEKGDAPTHLDSYNNWRLIQKTLSNNELGQAGRTTGAGTNGDRNSASLATRR